MRLCKDLPNRPVDLVAVDTVVAADSVVAVVGVTTATGAAEAAAAMAAEDATRTVVAEAAALTTTTKILIWVANKKVVPLVDPENRSHVACLPRLSLPPLPPPPPSGTLCPKLPCVGTPLAEDVMRCNAMQKSIET